MLLVIEKSFFVEPFNADSNIPTVVQDKLVLAGSKVEVVACRTKRVQNNCYNNYLAETKGHIDKHLKDAMCMQTDFDTVRQSDCLHALVVVAQGAHDANNDNKEAMKDLLLDSSF